MPLARRAPSPTLLTMLHQRCVPEAWSADAFARSLQQDTVHYRGWHEGAAVTGFCLYQTVATESQLLTLVVDQPFQRRGYGRRLLTAWEEAARAAHCEQLYLEVRATNHAALALYANSGFTIFHRRDGYYPDGSTALCLRKTLKP